MKKIDISTKKFPNTFALVDDEDYVSLNKHKWHPAQDKLTTYARRTTREGGIKSNVRMHREIMKTGREEMVDHRDHNGLNNRKINLRRCNNSQNSMNRVVTNGTSGYKGVCWNKKTKKWQAYIKKNSNQIHLGQFFCLIKAAKAYDQKAIELFGEYANPNFPEI